MDAYRNLEKLLLEEHAYLEPGMDFRKLCERAGADCAEMERMVARELGMSGEDLLETYRRQFFNMYKP